MKRGFLQAHSPATAKSLKPVPTASTLSASLGRITLPVDKVTSAAGNIKINHSADSQGISVKDDRTRIIQKSPLILQSDKYNSTSPYFGYFPPGSKEPEMVLVDHDLANIKAAAKWPVWQSIPDAHSSQKKLPFDIVPLEGMGMGMIATRAIAAGELIYKERPIYAARTILEIPFDLLSSGDFYSSALSRLGDPQQMAFTSLFNCFGNEKAHVHGILSTNTLQGELGVRIESNPPEVCVCFPILSRANHSCSPNVNYFFQFSDFTGRFYATRDIQCGEAVTVMYCELSNMQNTRKSELVEKFRFTCTCRAAARSLPRPALQSKATQGVSILRV